jgi:hypothetical protein
MTGNPAGVALGMKIHKYLKHGDEVEVRIGGLGSLKNRLSFECLIFAPDELTKRERSPVRLR